jgi:hypothetical protein
MLLVILEQKRLARGHANTLVAGAVDVAGKVLWLGDSLRAGMLLPNIRCTGLVVIGLGVIGALCRSLVWAG